MIRSGLLLAIAAFIGIAHAAAPAPAPPAFELALVDMQGQKKVLGTLPASVFAPRLSPDGTRVAFELAEDGGPPQNSRLYVAELDKLDKRRALQLTVTTARNLAPVWSADSDWIAFLALGNAMDALYWERSDGSAQPVYLVDGRAPEGLSKEGVLTYITRTGDHDYGISQLDTHTRKSSRLIDVPGSAQHSSRISPDGRWIAYASDETGRQEIWLEPLPTTGKRFQITRQGGRHPLWSPDGRTVYFDQDGRMFRVDVALGVETATAANPVALPISGFQQGDLRRQFDLTPDGKAFLMLFPLAGPPK
jgi:Tol biopolymer transport system component